MFSSLHCVVFLDFLPFVLGVMAGLDRENLASRSSAISDVTSPLYLNVSESPAAILVSQVFKGFGYVPSFGSWKRAMMIALSAKNKLGFVDGSCVKPDEGSPDLYHWERCNSMVISWLLNSLANEISESVLYCNSAAQIWAELEQRFGQTNGAEVYEIQKQLSQISQGASSVSTYYTKIKRLWDRIQSLRATPVCSTCGSIVTVTKTDEEQKLMQFLMGLNEQYTSIRGNILMMKPLPSVDQAYSIMMQEEKQREVYSNSHSIADSASMNVGYNNSQRGGISFQRGRGDNKRSMFCDYCKRPGHLKERCYKLHGFPGGYKSTKDRKFVAQVQGEMPEGNATDGIQNTAQVPDLTKDLYTKFLKFLNHQNEGESSIQLTGSANFAAMIS